MIKKIFAIIPYCLLGFLLGLALDYAFCKRLDIFTLEGSIAGFAYWLYTLFEQELIIEMKRKLEHGSLFHKN